MTIEDLEKAAIIAYRERAKNWAEKEKERRKQHLDDAFSDLQDKLPGLIVDEENDCFYFAGRKCRAVQRGWHYPGGSLAYCLELEPGCYVSDLASFGDFLLNGHYENATRA